MKQYCVIIFYLLVVMGSDPILLIVQIVQLYTVTPLEFQLQWELLHSLLKLTVKGKNQPF